MLGLAKESVSAMALGSMMGKVLEWDLVKATVTGLAMGTESMREETESPWPCWWSLLHQNLRLHHNRRLPGKRTVEQDREPVV